jgi:hypothetical protein
MKRSHALALSSVAFLLSLSTSSYAQAIRPGQQCEPAVADPSMYHNCRLRIVRGQEVCRCAVLPQALRRLNRDVTSTGSITPIPGFIPRQFVRRQQQRRKLGWILRRQ